MMAQGLHGSPWAPPARMFLLGSWHSRIWRRTRSDPLFLSTQDPLSLSNMKNTCVFCFPETTHSSLLGRRRGSEGRMSSWQISCTVLLLKHRL
jgi:hypothetical protein